MGTVHNIAFNLPERAPVCTVLTQKFAGQLHAFNDVTRDLRAAGIQIIGLDVSNTTITISPNCVDKLCLTFSSDMRGMMSRTEGKRTRNRTTVRGVDVVWFHPIREQDQ
ncbi:hypothetical protein [Pseudomonas asplenii]|uniref:Uncharacterized protein n=1 Tax=Pseudomonas asplenii TaxID=53407 RepID=A0A1H6NWZ1_9PSED|nr:hypothetical protein [Pseudomonas fuscovaginae]SEI21424.1 hypothetical protein SAMN05216581_4498 [Pseudomonas fuscovaginae]